MLRVEFGDPHAGWMDLTIQSETGVAKFAVSYVLYDTLSEMVDALDALATGNDRRSVRIFEEPEVSELRFRCEDDTLYLDVCRDLSFNGPRGIGGRTLFTARGSVLEMCLPFWRALRNLQTRFSEEELERRWRHPFPTSGMDKLTAHLRRLRGQ